MQNEKSTKIQKKKTSRKIENVWNGCGIDRVISIKSEEINRNMLETIDLMDAAQQTN